MAESLKIEHALEIEDVIGRLSKMQGVTGEWDGSVCRFSVNSFDPPVTGELLVTDEYVEFIFDKEDLSPKISGMIGFVVQGALLASPVDDE